MKSFLCIFLLAAIVMAEPPRFRQQSRFFARQQEETTPAPAEAPYAPSGWRPAGRAFELPQRQVQNTYGAPDPPAAYGPPSTTEAPTTAAPEEPTTVPPSEEDGANEFEEDGNQDEQQGEYYVALPDGRLQRVQYVSREDAAKMRYLAKIEARNVGPIYAYSPLQKLELIRPVKFEAPLAVVPIAAASDAPLSTSYTTVTTNFQPASGKVLLAAV
ncbi:uncharacterized protein LOC107275161 isoform X2 [Cephus cinctus]|uniref:Uncharacterized protein LOC107275161 isoform X2 n=1 Tax=Cephus cinctus TaxID=211228 RepID=A0AAJ7CH58_CEPCN|nr:uncharacterized protein LOC107275161 isoform X2 [Cephus cinctus]XP_015610494.1 uncharacterized protein LOC107275161 isoform X2 [Cephus cinctus]XP_015610495.1 uncharacterized protein LOC107275161 isoform X2 [Cephus cinctus]XP_015610496.1 uncharacterized protein LOC107275161 isoform X2 [Cephus cinctus]